jgi:hypothetical protein
MATSDAKVLLYVVDLGELRDWIGCKDEERFREAWAAIQDDEDLEWEPGELEVLERLLRRLVFEGALYEGIQEEERYYLTQILIDLFDEYVDQDSVSDDLPLDRLLEAVSSLGKGGEAVQLARWLLRGRELGSDRVIWSDGPVDDVIAYFGYLTRDEVPRFAEALGNAMKRIKGRPSGLLKQLLNAAEEAVRAEADLLSYVG